MFDARCCYLRNWPIIVLSLESPVFFLVIGRMGFYEQIWQVTMCNK